MYNTQSKLLNESQEVRLENAMKALREIIHDIKEQTGYKVSTFTAIAFINEDEMCELGEVEADTFEIKAKHAGHSKVLQELSGAAIVDIMGGYEEWEAIQNEHE